ncbi:rod shape-determining protein RodA [Egibacter rhizosphaerae]|uniref:peptidoglycan glycosyltransferase n=1 Tax=Egibacter rhizosphaerae TaxID=1670831 RepID=A0A411YBT3_9ACTN|nr:rod shape-determining protein RodA [Egibacter rhizosphaerae]QBI18659.1 rod shape-determining protein RodA [Egibacter rhizosphaerae]
MSTYQDHNALRGQREAYRKQWLSAYAPARQVDPVLVLVVLALAGIGFVFIYSATAPQLAGTEYDTLHFVNRQLVSFALGIAAMVAVTAFDYRAFRAWAPVLYLVSLVLLGVVLVVGEDTGQPTRALVLGGFWFQPAELAKPALIAILAALFHERREEALGLRALIEACVLAAIPMVLIVAQPDLGTAIVFVAITFAVLLLARVRIRYMVALGVIGVASILGALQLDILEQYQLERLGSFLNPEAADIQEDGYNLNQAQIAIGSGQLVGQGLFQGTQTRLGFVPENHTDFIFTVVAEETGFLGSALLLGLYGVLIWRGIRIAMGSRDTFGTLLAGGVVAVLGFQVFVNLGMSLGIMPITGLALPFVSYGGTSMISMFIMVGLLQNVHMRRFQ